MCGIEAVVNATRLCQVSPLTRLGEEVQTSDAPID
jgi:hypothetical protein